MFTGCAEQRENPENQNISETAAPVNPTNESEAETDTDNSQSENETTNIAENGEDYAKTDGFTFIYKDVNIYLDEHTERILGELEPAIDYHEENSCSFDGLAKIYFYNGFEIATYLKDKTDNDRVYSITFNDDSVSTVEGICIGQTLDDVISAYGTEYKELQGVYTVYRYVKSGTLLSFSIEDGVIVSILYQVEDMYA
jgi:hypothetical protein